MARGNNIEGFESYYTVEEQLYTKPVIEGASSWREVPGTRYGRLTEVGEHFDKIKNVRPSRIVKIEKTVVTQF